MKKVLITDGVHPLLLEGLKSEGYQCDYQANISLEEVRNIVDQYEGMIINSKILVDRAMIDKGKHLRFVGRLGSGMEIIDQVYAKEKGIAVLSVPEGNRNAVAEHALGMLLAMANNMVRSDREVRAKIWQREKNRGFEIIGKTVGLIGFGNTGKCFAKKLSGMGVSVLAYDKYKENFAEDLSYVKEVTMQEIYAEADIISFHIPLNSETLHLVDQSFINKCKDGLILINTSRGKIIHTEHLIEALTSGKLKGACLDVFENEKPNKFSEEEHQLYNRLYQFENLILSPHVAGWTHESKRKLAFFLLEKILKVIRNTD